MRAILAGCPSCRHHWLLWVPAVIPIAGCKSVTLNTEPWLLLSFLCSTLWWRQCFFRIWNMGCQPTLGGRLPSLPPSPPFPSPPLPSPPTPFPSPPLEVGPLFAAMGSGGALKQQLKPPSRSGQSPAAKRFLVLFELKILHLVSCCLDQVDHQMCFCAL